MSTTTYKKIRGVKFSFSKKDRFPKTVFFLNKAVAPFIFNELCRVPHLVFNRGLEKFCRSLAKAQFGNANLLEISKHHSSLAFSWCKCSHLNTNSNFTIYNFIGLHLRLHDFFSIYLFNQLIYGK